MGGKFINTEVVNELDSVAESFKDRLTNPFYNFIQQKGTTVTYFNIDLANMPLDSVTGMDYSSIGDRSNIKYNRVNNFVIYGFEHAAVTINNEDEGTEGEEISGSAIIIPNTIHPYAGDYFIINHMSDKVLFRVIDAQSDTFDNGANVWEVRYKLEHYKSDELLKHNIGTTSEFILNNVGTQYSPVIKDSVYNTIARLEEILDGMRRYYYTIFYTDRVNSLIFSANNNRFYDSFLTEFVIKNHLFEAREDFVLLQHQVSVPATFALDYSRSFFYVVETKKIKKLSTFLSVSYGQLIDSKVNIFSTRHEQYLKMNYIADPDTKFLNSLAPGVVFEVFDKVFISKILNGSKFGNDILSDIIIKYFNNQNLTDDDLDALDMINYNDNIQLFYYVPVVMYVLEYYIKQLMSKQAN